MTSQEARAILEEYESRQTGAARMRKAIRTVLAELARTENNLIAAEAMVLLRNKDLLKERERAERAEEKLRQIVCSCGESAITHRIDYGQPSEVRQHGDDGECSLDKCGEWGAAGDWKARAERAEEQLRLSIIDAANEEARANDAEAELERLKALTAKV